MIAATLGDMERLATVMTVIGEARDRPGDIRALVIEALTMIEEMVLRLNLEPAGPDKLNPGQAAGLEH